MRSCSVFLDSSLYLFSFINVVVGCGFWTVLSPIDFIFVLHDLHIYSLYVNIENHINFNLNILGLLLDIYVLDNCFCLFPTLFNLSQ